MKSLYRAWLARSAVRRLLTIRVRLTMWYVALLALILLGFSAFLYLRLESNLYQALDNSLLAEARSLAQNMDSENGLLRFGEGTDQVSPGSIEALYDRTGQALIGGTPRWPLDASAEARREAIKGTPVLITIRPQVGEEWRVVAMPIQNGDQTAGVVELGRSENEVEGALNQLLILIGIAVPATLLLATGGGWFFADRALGPIDRITTAARRIGAENLSQRIGLRPRADEIGRLAGTFDMMLDRLERAFERQRQFAADASHELRTPLAVMGSQIDVALQRRRSEAEYAEVLNEVRSEVEHMNELVGELSALSQGDSGSDHLDPEILPLDELASAVVAHLTPIAVKRKVRLEMNTLEPVNVLGDQTRLTELLINLLDNALKHTPAGGRVLLQVERDSSWAIATVADNGVGIPAEHLPHIFERFYRVDKARSRAEGGSGLGLSICDWIVRAHKGRIEVSSTPGHGTTFTVFIPLYKLPDR